MFDQGRVIPSKSNSVVEVNNHRFEVMGVGVVVLHVFLIHRQHQRSILALFLVYIAVMYDGTLANGWSGALILQNCPFAHWHVVNSCSKTSMAFISSCDIPKYLVSMSYHANRLPLGMNRLKTW